MANNIYTTLVGFKYTEVCVVILDEQGIAVVYSSCCNVVVGLIRYWPVIFPSRQGLYRVE
jgi:hypothetical protein